jgi:hypothetical protein
VSPASVDRDGNANLIDAAATEGADLVLMSIVSASVDSPMELLRVQNLAPSGLSLPQFGQLITGREV